MTAIAIIASNVEEMGSTNNKVNFHWRKFHTLLATDAYMCVSKLGHNTVR